MCLLKQKTDTVCLPWYVWHFQQGKGAFDINIKDAFDIVDGLCWFCRPIALSYSRRLVIVINFEGMNKTKLLPNDNTTDFNKLKE